MIATIAAVLAAFLGIAIGFWLRSNSARAELALMDRRAAELAAQLNQVREALSVELQNKSAAESATAARIASLETELANERGNGQRLTDQFKVLAQEILEKNSKTFTDQNKESLGHLLNPLTKDLTEFRTRVEQVNQETIIGRTQLAAELANLKTLNQRLTDEAHNLSSALRRDTKAQGNWGEMILLDLLENQGLRKGEHYTFQQSFNVETEEGDAKRRQTDVIVKLPEGRHLIIDSKVSINAYNDSLSATTEADRAAAIKRHVASVRAHITELASRNYTRLPGIESPDFVVMFVPIEPAFLMAVQHDESLWMEAYEKGVLLTGPTTLLFVIRIVESLWRQEQQAKNVREVMDRGAALYEKFVGFANNFESVGLKINDARSAFDEATRQLATGPGNLVRQVEMLKDLGVRPKNKKRLPKKLLDDAGVEDTQLELAANSEDE
jgi:DNA recombination protein RmuC